MTQEEKLKLALMRQMQGQNTLPQAGPQPPMSPNVIAGTSAGMAPPGQAPQSVGDLTKAAGVDTSGKQAMLARQMRGARERLSAGGPEGRQMGRVYRAPNWGDNLANVGDKLLAGYELGKGKETQDGIDEQDAAALEARGGLADLAAKEDKTALALTAAKYAAAEEAKQAAIDLDAANRLEKRGWEVEDRDIADANAVAVAEIRKKGQQGQGLGVPAAIESGLLRNEGTTANIGEVIGEIEALDAEGKATSGPTRALVNMIPQDWRGIAEDIAFGADEQKTQAKLNAIDVQMMKAVNSDRLSDADAKMLAGIRAGIGGLKPYQQIARLQAANEIMKKYGMAITGEEEGDKKAVSDMTKEELEAELGG